MVMSLNISHAWPVVLLSSLADIGSDLSLIIAGLCPKLLNYHTLTCTSPL